MDALVAGIAFYPDQIIEQILEATQYPDAIAQATNKNAVAVEGLELPASVQSLTSSPEILRQLNDNPALTARLGLAARTQLAELWAAVDRVRQQFEASQTESTDAADAATATGAVPVAYPTGAFVAGYWTAQVVDEVGAWYMAAAPLVYGEGAVVVTGPNGTTAVVSGSGPQTVENLSGAVEMYLASHFAGFPNGLPPPGLYHRILKEIEVPLLTAALAANRGNQIRAADLLGLNRNTLRKKIRDLDIQVYRSGS